MSAAKSMLEPVADVSGTELPPRFADALKQIRFAASHCGMIGVPNDTMLAAMVADLMPRLVEAYGADKTALFLNQLSNEIAGAQSPPPKEG